MLDGLIFFSMSLNYDFFYNLVTKLQFVSKQSLTFDLVSPGCDSRDLGTKQLMWQREKICHLPCDKHIIILFGLSTLPKFSTSATFFFLLFNPRRRVASAVSHSNNTTIFSQFISLKLSYGHGLSLLRLKLPIPILSFVYKILII